MYILGKLVEKTKAASLKTVEKALMAKIGDKFKKDPKLKEDNFRALRMGCQHL
jgi:hypothetical protein